MHYILHRLIAQRFSGAHSQSKARYYDLKMHERIERIFCWLAMQGFNAHPLLQQRPAQAFAAKADTTTNNLHMQYNFTFTPLKGLVLLAVAGLCSFPAQSHAIASGPVPVVAKSAFARITGKIVDENGDPLPGATILVKGTSNGVVTNAEGVFVIEAEMGNTLLVSYLGYVSQEVVVNSASLDIKLLTDATTLQDVVVIGYGEEKRADVTGAVAQVKSENFRQGLNTSPDVLIQGKVAGVRVVNSSGEPGAGMDVVIRGIGSVRSGSTPCSWWTVCR